MVLFTVAPAAFASAQSLDGFIESFRAAQVSAPMVRDGARLTVPAGVVRADVGDGSWPQDALSIPAVRLPDGTAARRFLVWQDPGTGAVMMSGGDGATPFAIADAGIGQADLLAARYGTSDPSRLRSLAARCAGRLSPSRVVWSGFISGEYPAPLRSPQNPLGDPRSLPYDTVPGGLATPDGFESALVLADTAGGFRQFKFPSGASLPQIVRLPYFTVFVGLEGPGRVSGFGHDPDCFDPCCEPDGNPRFGWISAPSKPVGVIKAAASAGSTVYLLGSNGRVTQWGGRLEADEMGTLPSMTGVVDVVAGCGYGAALLDTGRVRAWSGSLDGFNGTPSGVTGATAIAGGEDFCVALTSSGTAKCWGPFTAPPSATGLVAVAAGYYAVGLRQNGSVMAWDPWDGTAMPVPGITGASVIGCGGGTGAALTPDGVALWDIATGVALDVPSGTRGFAADRSGVWLFMGDGSVRLYGEDVPYLGAMPQWTAADGCRALAASEMWGEGAVYTVTVLALRGAAGTINSDADCDGAPLASERLAGSDPADPDTDGDGIPDGVEMGMAPTPLFWRGGTSSFLPGFPPAVSARSTAGLSGAALCGGGVWLCGSSGLEELLPPPSVTGLAATATGTLGGLAADGGFLAWRADGASALLPGLGLAAVSGGYRHFLGINGSGRLLCLEETPGQAVLTNRTGSTFVSSLSSSVSAVAVSAGDGIDAAFLSDGKLRLGSALAASQYSDRSVCATQMLDQVIAGPARSAALLKTNGAYTVYRRSSDTSTSFTPQASSGPRGAFLGLLGGRVAVVLTNGVVKSCANGSTSWSTAFTNAALTSALAVDWTSNAVAAVSASGGVSAVWGAAAIPAVPWWWSWRDVSLDPADPSSGAALLAVSTSPTDPDSDGDGFPDGWELANGFDPLDPDSALPDSDSDGIPDEWEAFYGLDPSSAADAALDPDADGLTNSQEFINGTNPIDRDTDVDGYSDGWELANGFDPLDPDSALPDSDSDGMPDEWEVFYGFNPADPLDAALDPDEDGLCNADEYDANTNPFNSDTDGDGIPDGWECLNGLNPIDWSDVCGDPDGDGIPNVYEWFYDRNPLVADAESVNKICVGGTNAVQTLEAALRASSAYSVIEIAPGVYSGNGWSMQWLPSHPVLITTQDGGRDRRVIIRLGQNCFAGILLDERQTVHTVIQGLCMELCATNGVQSAFFCGGNAPTTGQPASGMFRNIYVKMKNPNVYYYGWHFRHFETNEVVIAGCVIDAGGTTIARGIRAVDGPPMSVENCTFVNFPPDANGNSVGIQYESTSQNYGGAPDPIPLEVVNCIFDESFANAYAIAPCTNGVAYDVTVLNCIVPSESSIYAGSVSGLLVTNACVSASGHLPIDSPARGMGVPSLFSPLDIDGQLRGDSLDIGADRYSAEPKDTDGDGVSDSDEDWLYGSNPFFPDTDGDNMPDGTEIQDGTNPSDSSSYCYNLSAEVTSSFNLFPELAVAVFNQSYSTNSPISTVFRPELTATNVFYPKPTATNFNFGHIVHLSSTTPHGICLWLDANTNGLCDVGESALWETIKPKEHATSFSLKVPMVWEDADRDKILDRWELANGLCPTNAADAWQDWDGDGLINLHEFWTKCNPSVYDGTNYVLSAFAKSIDSRIAGTQTANAWYRFVNYPDTELNTNCWAYGADFSSTSVKQNSADPHAFNVTAVSKRHVLGATHYNYHASLGTVYYFLGTNNVVYTRTLVATNYIPNVDVMVGLLDEDLPDSVVPAKILPENWYEYIGPGYGLPTVVFNKFRQAVIMDLNYLPQEKTVCAKGLFPQNADRLFYAARFIDGDSSNPRYLLSGNETVLLHLMWRGEGGEGTFLTLLKNDIQAHMNLLMPGYQLEEFDLSAWDKLPEFCEPDTGE
ncbi:MAG: hypothetical protein IJU44_13465 [Kiritimatiellae bacterium]|nr:hypothetical protein [Kiritimatiellia bacterium]